MSPISKKISDNENIKPTIFLPIWDLLGVTLGFGTTMLGEKAAMLCTASVEEVIDGHYKSQLDKLGDDEESLKKLISKYLFLMSFFLICPFWL